MFVSLLLLCRGGSLVLTTPVVVTGFVLDKERARPPTRVDEAGMLQVSGLDGWVWSLVGNS